jgi:CheY-like chemotaxis protein
VIEDDDGAAELITAALRREGYQTMRAATAEEGLVRAAKRKPDLITLDIFLPAMNGWDLMNHLNADPRLADTPVVIISVAPDHDRAVALGARRVLVKPLRGPELKEALAGIMDPGPGLDGHRVLVVDDNVKAVEVLGLALENEGFTVLRAYGGAEAIKVAQRSHPDLVILDLLMPGVSGFEVAREMRSSPDTRGIPIVVVTAKDLSVEDRERLDGEVVQILAKATYSGGELVAEVRRALPQRVKG